MNEMINEGLRRNGLDLDSWTQGRRLGGGFRDSLPTSGPHKGAHMNEDPSGSIINADLLKIYFQNELVPP